MRIGIDISQIVYKGTGVATYTCSLVESLLKIDKESEYVLFGSSLRRKTILKDFIKNQNAKNIHKKISILPPKLLEFLWNGIHVLPIESFIGNIDVFHSSDWLEPPTKKAKRITTIHDLAIYKYPETFSIRGGHNIVENQKRKLFFVKNYTDKIIAVSENTKKDIVEILKISEKRIEVVYEAADPVYFKRGQDEVSLIKEKYCIKGDYILCVGSREPRKNLSRVLESFVEISRAYPELSLVIVGKYGWGNDINPKSEIRNSKLKMLGYVEKEDLAALYSGAVIFVYPSLYEGFGLPILEAMACSCPVVTSNIGSMKEIAGDAALLIDPKQSEEISGAISKIIRNTSISKDLREKGLKQANKFNWEKTALQTLNIYHKVLE